MLAAGVMLPRAAVAATVPATPPTLANVLESARPGDVIRLAPGQYPFVDLKARKWQPAITVEAGDAVVEGVRATGVTGLHWRGGVFEGGGQRSTGFAAIKDSNDIRVEGGKFSAYTRNGIIVASSSDVDLVNNRLSAMGSDGIQIAESRRMLVEGNSCLEFRPTDKAHPDCIQLWSRPTSPPTADIMIRNNVMKGSMQGIGLFNHVRKGVNDGGYDRITIIGNDIAISDYYHGIALYACRGCLVRDNKVVTLPGANPKVRARIGLVDSEQLVACANSMSSFPADKIGRRCQSDEPRSVSQTSASQR